MILKSKKLFFHVSIVSVFILGMLFLNGSSGNEKADTADDIYKNIDMLIIRLLLPVGRSFWAIAAGYVGLFAVLFLPAPIALILGIIAIYDIKTHPKRRGMGRAIFGLVMGGIFTALLLIFLVAGAMKGFK